MEGALEMPLVGEFSKALVGKDDVEAVKSGPRRLVWANPLYECGGFWSLSRMQDDVRAWWTWVYKISGLPSWRFGSAVFMSKYTNAS